MTLSYVCYDRRMVKDKFYYIVGVSLLVLLVLIVYVGSGMQNVERGLMNVDNRLSAIESQLGVTDEAAYDGYENPYSASVYDAFSSYDESQYGPYDYVVE